MAENVKNLKRKPASQGAALAPKQQRFLERMGTRNPFYTLFEHLPGISFFAKNAKFEIVYSNSAFRERVGVVDETELVGRTDYELFPKSLADHFRMDDEWVILKMSPQELITKPRMKSACEMLSAGEESILEIALSLGFYDQGSFTLQFRNHLDVTPLQYRKLHQTG